MRRNDSQSLRITYRTVLSISKPQTRNHRCDPYCIVEVAGASQKTGVHKNCYDASFDEGFVFRSQT